MRRVKKHKVKQERPETSSSMRDNVERDLTYYIHDRVELMHQVFSVLKPKELKAMAPQSVQYISISDLQELCTEELLGISSKRLCAILDGAEPPSDTESSSTSSSQEKLETISLDSISSDEEILSQGSSKKKKHKHRHRKSKTKHKPNSSSENSDNDRSKANRAGLTVLELLELQARARAIRAQLQQEQINTDVTDLTTASTEHHASDDEVEIKEEPAEVVEISSEDEKPKLEDLQKEIMQTTKNSTESSGQEGQTVTKRINDLIITVPQAKPTRKIKLNRNISLTTIQNPSEASSSNRINAVSSNNEITAQEVNKDKRDGNLKAVDNANKNQNAQQVNRKKSEPTKNMVVKEKQKKKQKKRGKQKANNKDGSDHDEITLELSDSEKMDLLEDLDRKNLDNVSSSGTEDSERSSNTEDETGSGKTKVSSKTNEVLEDKSDKEVSVSTEIDKNHKDSAEYKNVDENAESMEVVTEATKEIREIVDNDEQSESLDDKAIEITTVNDIPIRNECENFQDISEDQQNCSNPEVGPTTCTMGNSDITEKGNGDHKTEESGTGNKDITEEDNADNKLEEISTGSLNSTETNNVRDRSEPITKVINRDLSEGELSDRASSEVEASEVKPEVVCISDDDTSNKKSHKKKKNKKKEKKSKKDKKSKKSPDFRKDADQNFFEESNSANNLTLQPPINNVTETISLEDDDDIYEVLELSSDYSCNEEGNAVLSKEPTKEEIEALSAKIDEIEREDIVTEERIKEHERLNEEKMREGDVENISWKDRYLDSKKVKRVLSTSSIFNAMRKKNKELKIKLEEAKKEAAKISPEVIENDADKSLEEGSIEQYNTLEGSTKYVDPICEEKELENKEDSNKEISEGEVTKEMKKDAKQLLKMYKKLLMYNDMNRQSNPNKKKKKKQKKNKADKTKDEKIKEVDVGIEKEIVS